MEISWPNFLRSAGLSVCEMGREGAVRIADFNQDGFDDVVLVGSLSVCSPDCVLGGLLLPGGEGGNRLLFGDQVHGAFPSFVTGPQYGRMFVANLNGDNYPDLFYAELYSPTAFVTVLVNDNGKGFLDETARVIGGFVAETFSVLETSAAMGDVNADGLDDFLIFYGTLVGTSRAHSVMFVSQPNFTFVDASAALFGADQPKAAGGAALMADLTGDGRSDVVVLGETDSFIYNPLVYLQEENGTFSLLAGATGLPYVSSPGIAAGLFDGDDVLDVAISALFRTSSSVRMIFARGLGNGTFAETPNAFSDDTVGSFSADALDFDQDGNLDVIRSLVSTPGRVIVYFGNGAGNFSDSLELPNSKGAQVASFATSSALFYMQIGSDIAIIDDSYSVVLGEGRSYRNVGDVVFKSSESFSSMERPAVALGDFISDECEDAVFCGIAPTLQYGCEVMQGSCDGQFVRAPEFGGVGEFYGGTALSDDWDADGRDDFFVSGIGSPGATVASLQMYLSSRGTGNAAASAIPGGFVPWVGRRPVNPTQWASVDWNGDSKVDLVFTYQNSTVPSQNSVVFLANLGNGTFELANSPYPLLSGPPDLDLDTYSSNWADLSGTGRKDYILVTYVASTSIGNYAAVYRNLANGSLALDNSVITGIPRHYFTPPVLIQDFDGNGALDVLVVPVYNVFYSSGGFIAWGETNGTFSVFDYRSIPLPLFESESPTLDPVVAAASTLTASEALVLGRISYNVDQSAPFVSVILSGHPNRTLTSDNLGVFANDATIAVGDIDADGRPDAIIAGSTPTNCRPPYVLGAPRPVVSTASSSGTGDVGTGASDSGSESSASLGGIIGGILGGGIALMFLLACCAAVIICCACVACFLVIIVAVVVVLAAAVVVTAVAATVAGVGVGGGGGGVAYALTRKGRSGDDDDGNELAMFEEEPSDMTEVLERMQATTEYRRLAWNELRFGQKIGEGAYGAVYAGQWGGVKVAIKVLKADTLTPAALLEFSHEALMMAKVSHHPNIVTLVGAVIDEEHLSLVTHFAEKGALDSLLPKGALSEADKRRIATECAAGVAFLHTQDIVHRDIAARNVLLDGVLHAQIADFGYSRVLDQGADEQTTKSNVGPVRWMAPEAISEQKYSSASDVWSFGMLLYEIFHDGALPYNEYDSLADVAVAVVREHTKPVVSPAVPADITAVMRDIWAYNASDRPTMVEIIPRIPTTSELSSIVVPTVAPSAATYTAIAAPSSGTYGAIGAS